MSEFSDSYHLLGSDARQVKRLLRAAQRHGAVLPAVQGRRWLALLVDGVADAGAPAQVVVQHNQGVLLHLAYGEDHGLWLRLFEGALAVGALALTRRGGDAGEPGRFCAALARLGGAGAAAVARLEALVAHHADGAGDALPALRDEMVELLGLAAARQLSCADLGRDRKALAERFPGLEPVLEKRRGAADKALPGVPNRWCPAPGLPWFMYLPVPEGEVDASMLARHLEHWLTTGDFDEERQAGFWLLTAYQRALPARHRHLGDRIMNLGLAFPHQQYAVELERTLRGILVVASADFDWAPYLERRAGEQRL